LTGGLLCPYTVYTYAIRIAHLSHCLMGTCHLQPCQTTSRPYSCFWI